MRGCAALLLAIALGCGGSPPPTAKSDPAAATPAVDPRLIQARQAAARRDLDAARALYAEAATDDSSRALLTERVRFLIEAGRAEEAASLAEAYYDAEVSDLAGIALFAEALIAEGTAAASLRAGDVTAQLLELAGRTPEALRLRGQALLALGQLQAAADLLVEAAAATRDDVALSIAAGEALLRAKDPDGAVVLLRATVGVAPDDARTHRALGVALREARAPEDARASLMRAIELDPKDGRAWLELGLLRNRLGEQGPAEEALIQATTLAPGLSTAWYAYGEILRIQGKAADAQAAYRRAIELSPAFPKALSKLAAMLLEADQADEAEAVLTGAVRAHPEQVVFVLYLAEAYHQRGKWDAAVEAYESFLAAASANDPERARARTGRDRAKRKRPPATN